MRPNRTVHDSHARAAAATTRLPRGRRTLGTRSKPRCLRHPVVNVGVKPMVSQERVRELALALPEVVERDHHGRPSFRIAGKIFATVWDAGHVNVMLDEGGVKTAVEDTPAACDEVWWGRRLAAVRVAL